MTDFNTIIAEDGFVKGELADGGVVTVSDDDWTDADEDTLEGNWERATRAVVKDIMDTESLGTDVQSGETVSVDHDRFVDALIDSSIVEHKDSTEERRRAELLLEHLVREGVYERRGEEIVVLDEFDFSSDEFTKLNWTAFFSYAVEEINSVVESAENQKEAITEMFEQADGSGTVPIDTDLPSRRELMEDLKRVTGSNIEPAGFDENDHPIPPEGVAPEDEWEYKQVWEDLSMMEEFQIDDDRIEVVDPTEALGLEIRKMKRVAARIQKIEQQLREASIGDIANMPEVQEKIEMIQTFADSVLAGNTEERNTKEIAESIKQSAQQEDIDLTGDVETTDGVEEPNDPIQEAQEATESEPGEAKNVEDLGLGSDPQHD